MKKLIWILFFLTLKSTAQSSINKEIEYFEIKSKSKIDSTFIIMNAGKTVKVRAGKEKFVNEEDRDLLKKFINDLFVTKKYRVFTLIEKIEGFKYSSDQILIINLKFNENERDTYYIDLSVPNYKVVYSDEFKAFLKLFYNIR